MITIMEKEFFYFFREFQPMEKENLNLIFPCKGEKTMPLNLKLLTFIENFNV